RRAAGAGDQGADDGAGGPAGPSERHRQDVAGGNRLLEGAFVILDEDPAHDSDAGDAEGGRDRRAVGVGRCRRADRNDVGARGHGHAKAARPMPITMRAYNPAIRSSNITPIPPVTPWLPPAATR